MKSQLERGEEGTGGPSRSDGRFPTARFAVFTARCLVPPLDGPPVPSSPHLPLPHQGGCGYRYNLGVGRSLSRGLRERAVRITE